MRPRGPSGLGLSGKLLLLTVPLVMIAAVLLYVPAIANFWVNRLNDRVAAANTAALVLDAAPLGMVPESLSREILKSINARAVAIKMGQQRRLLASDNLPTAIEHDIDLRDMTVWEAITGSFRMMLETGNQAIRIVGPGVGNAQFIEIVTDELPLAADVSLLPQRRGGRADHRGADRGPRLSRAALSLRAPDAAADREPGRLPRKPRKLGADHRAEPAQR